MSRELDGAVASEDLEQFSRAISADSLAPCARGRRLNIDPDQVKNGLAQLALTLVKLLHELMERQAIRRIDVGDLSEAEIDRLGTTLMKQGEVICSVDKAKELGLDWWTNNSVLNLRNQTDISMEERVAKLESMASKTPAS